MKKAEKRTKVTEAVPNRVRLSVVIPPMVLERAKNCVYWTPGLTLGGLAEIALVALLDKMERQNGGPFPPRTAALKAGRPFKV